MKKVTYIFRSPKSPKILIDVPGILLAMLLAGFLGRNATEVLTRPIGDELMKWIVGIFTGISIGLGTGVVVRRVWGQFTRIVS